MKIYFTLSFAPEARVRIQAHMRSNYIWLSVDIHKNINVQYTMVYSQPIPKR